MIYTIYLIRHGKTQSNLERRYSGVIDEPLNVTGSRELAERIKAGYYPEVQQVYVSPMRRCRQTAELIYPQLTTEVISGFAEYNFGDFEGKNYEELKDNQAYQKWIDSGGKEKVPGGEEIQSYKKRCCLAFDQVVEKIRRDKILHTALIVHGGTIMSILEKFVPSEKSFYGWQIPNCEGYKLVIMDQLWKKEKIIKYYKKLGVDLDVIHDRR